MKALTETCFLIVLSWWLSEKSLLVNGVKPSCTSSKPFPNDAFDRSHYNDVGFVRDVIVEMVRNFNEKLKSQDIVQKCQDLADMRTSWLRWLRWKKFKVSDTSNMALLNSIKEKAGEVVKYLNNNISKVLGELNTNDRNTLESCVQTAKTRLLESKQVNEHHVIIGQLNALKQNVSAQAKKNDKTLGMDATNKDANSDSNTISIIGKDAKTQPESNLSPKNVSTGNIKFSDEGIITKEPVAEKFGSPAFPAQEQTVNALSSASDLIPRSIEHLSPTDNDQSSPQPAALAEGNHLHDDESSFDPKHHMASHKQSPKSLEEELPISEVFDEIPRSRPIRMSNLDDNTRDAILNQITSPAEVDLSEEPAVNDLHPTELNVKSSPDFHQTTRNRAAKGGFSASQGLCSVNGSPTWTWDSNWDKREPEALVSPAKSDDRLERDEYEKEIEKNTSTTSRHLILIRHGQYTNSAEATDFEKKLTTLGEKQALATGERLKVLGLPYASIVSSTMTRAHQTATFINTILPGVPVETCPMLQEGSPCIAEPNRSKWRPELIVYRDSARIEAAFRKYVHRAPPEQLEDSYDIIVGHGNVIRYFVCRGLQLLPNAWSRFAINHASITWLIIRPDGRVTLRTYNDVGHMHPDFITE